MPEDLTPTAVGTPQDGPTYTLHAVGRWGHYAILALGVLSYLGEHLRVVGDQAQGTIQVTIGASAVAFVGSHIAAALASRGRP